MVILYKLYKLPATFYSHLVLILDPAWNASYNYAKKLIIRNIPWGQQWVCLLSFYIYKLILQGSNSALRTSVTTAVNQDDNCSNLNGKLIHHVSECVCVRARPAGMQKMSTCVFFSDLKHLMLIAQLRFVIFLYLKSIWISCRPI